MKKFSIFLLSFVIFLSVLAQYSYIPTRASTTPIVMWRGMELKPGQIGLATIIKSSTLFKINGNTKTVDRTLKAGEKYRIYNFKPGYLGLGGGYYVVRDSKVKYETPSKEKLQQVLKSGEEIINGIKTKYFGHTYGVKNQAEYDTVIKIASSTMAGYQNNQFLPSPEYISYFDKYFEGDRADNYSTGSKGDRALTVIDGSIGELVKAGISKSEIIRLLKAHVGSLKLVDIPNSGAVGGSSAYDALVRGEIDCDSGSHAVASMYETVGYRTKIIATKTHAELLVQVGGSWWSPIGGDFSKVDLNNLGNYHIYVN